MVWLFFLHRMFLLLLIHKPTGGAVSKLYVQRLAIVFFSTSLLFLGPPSAKFIPLDLVPNPNTMLLPMPWLKLLSFASYLSINTVRFRLPPWSTVTMSLLSIYLSSNPVHYQRTKHVKIDIHFVHYEVALGLIRVLHVFSQHQFADIFTKGLSSALFPDFVSILNIRATPVLTEGAVRRVYKFYYHY